MVANPVIVFANSQGPSSIAVMFPSGELPIEEMIDRHIDKTQPYVVMAHDDLPNEDTDFFDAWELVGSDVHVNLEKAKVIWKQLLRGDRAPLLQKLDIDFMRAVEAGDLTLQQSIALEKQTLRDITAHPALAAAQTAAELRALTVEALLMT